MIFPVSSPAPSVEECSKPAMSGKPVIVVNTEEPALVKRDNKVAESEEFSNGGCIFKRGVNALLMGVWV